MRVAVTSMNNTASETRPKFWDESRNLYLFIEAAVAGTQECPFQTSVLGRRTHREKAFGFALLR
jgi:hypothetical protein